jgi:hypothetical protein
MSTDHKRVAIAGMRPPRGGGHGLDGRDQLKRACDLTDGAV